MENSKNEKVIKILKRVGIGISLAFNFLFALALIIGSASVNKNKTQCALAESDIQAKVEFKQDNKKFVSYNDENYSITLSVDELNNYIFDNLYNILNVNGYPSNAFDGSEISYNNVSYNLDSFTPYDSLSYSYDSNNIDFYLDDPTISTHKFKYVVSSLDTPFEYSIVWTVSDDIYADIKQAIELDIQANESNINDGIFDTLTASTVGFIGTLGSGITAMTSVFYDSANSQLTTIGLLSVIVVAVSLCYFLFRLLIGLIRMRG